MLHQFGDFQAQSCTLWGVTLCAIAKCRRITASLTPTQRVTIGCLSAGRRARRYAASVSHVSMTDPQAAFSQAGRSCPPGQPERAALFSRAMSYGQDGDCPARLIDTSKRGHRSHLARARRDHSPPIQIAPCGAFGSEATEISRVFPPSPLTAIFRRSWLCEGEYRGPTGHWHLAYVRTEGLLPEFQSWSEPAPIFDVISDSSHLRARRLVCSLRSSRDIRSDGHQRRRSGRRGTLLQAHWSGAGTRSCTR